MKTRSKFRLITPAKACVLLQAYINQVKRLKANKYKRENEKTYDSTQVFVTTKRSLIQLTSIAVFNKGGRERGILLGNEASELEKEVRESIKKWMKE